MARSDFAWVRFNHAFTVTDPTETRTFTVEGNPVRTGYLLVQAFGVDNGNHQIEINDQPLPNFDIAPDGSNEWQTWMDRIPEGFLQPGPNRITITRSANDDFRIANVAVHWRERD